MYKFLDPSLATHFRRKETVYPVPGPGEKWGPWLSHPHCHHVPDGRPCGPGGFHLMKIVDASHAPLPWWIWFAEGRHLLGEDGHKARFAEVRLRHISRNVFHRMLRTGMARGKSLYHASLPHADLHGASLHNTFLAQANLSCANLQGADLRFANLESANCHTVDMSHADLSYAKLTGTNLSDVSLFQTNFHGANLSYANLSGVELNNLTDLEGANLFHAIVDETQDELEGRGALFLGPADWKTR